MIKEQRLDVFIESIQNETNTIKRFVMKRLDGKKLSSFIAGSHIKLFIPSERGEMERRYSLTSDPNNREFYEIAVKWSIDSKGGSSYLHTHASVGDSLQISFPKNYFSLSPSARHHVFYAAGIGITPFLSMLTMLKRGGESFKLHYAATSKQDCAFYHRLKNLSEKEISFYFSSDRQRLNTDSLYNHQIGTHIYICGPTSFTTSFKETALEIGYPSVNIHYEHFGSPIPAEFASSFLIQFNDGRQLVVNQDVSVLDTLVQAGHSIPFSCKIGRCGTCEIKVKAGSILHLDEFLTDDEKQLNKSMMVCVSRCKGELLQLDLE
ncbi:PDR/VanB family oxidoreductase [Sutcliffiella rhizosphaerae]|uniref:Carnitine monooxygenase reductase subunit n=1 Tax=Sutcliffiella rhizosphaerae TaxID=2880967 RepID=A0ABM8YJB0_9BACI|nr:PDR/VanB family oxidoreductase [Sutcliffiella rhizosphaerae]CAG9620016.1 Carnitine monooxygenase reductase subunit [Sutcliffiella rhizosphaerae]